MSQPAPTKEDFSAWRDHPVTRLVMQMLRDKREQLRQDWEGGSFTDYSKDTTVLVNVGNLGTCKGYAFVTDLEYEQLMTEMELDNAEQIGPKATRSGRVS